MRRHTALEAWLPTARQVVIAELLTVTSGATVWRYTNTVADVVDGADTYLGSASAGGLLWDRDRLTFAAGIELSTCTLTLHPRDGDTINALPVAQAIRAGAWDTATMLLSRAYFDDAGTLRGVLPRYSGQLGPVRMEGGDVQITLRPPSQVLNRQVPPVYQSSCLNTLYDAACGVNRASNTATGTVQASSSMTLIYTGLTGVADGYYTGGVITITSGALAGLSRTIKRYSADGSSALLYAPLPTAPAAGVTFAVVPGCDRSLGAGGCARFDNRLRYRGQPYIPKAETAV